MVELRTAVQSDLEDVLVIAKAWPKRFVPAGVTAIENGFRSSPAIIAHNDGDPIGFVIWDHQGEAAELLWIAVRPDLTRNAIGSRLVKRMREAIGVDTTVVVKTATADSTIPGTIFDAADFDGTRRFYEALGFRAAGVLKQHWGETNHALLMELKPRKHGRLGRA